MGKTVAVAVDITIIAFMACMGAVNFSYFVVNAVASGIEAVFAEFPSSLAFMGITGASALFVALYAAFLAIWHKPRAARIRRSLAFRLARVVFASFALLFAAVEIVILSAVSQRPAPPTDIVVILGAHVNKAGPSMTLRSRLDVGLEYLRSNPGAKVVLCGGQGVNEPSTEASAMRDYLVARGVDSQDIVLEDTSRTTFENLTNAVPAMAAAGLVADGGGGAQGMAITIITSDFHMFRAKMIARRIGFTPYGVCAPTPRSVALSSYSREFFGLVKSFLFDRP